MRRRVIDATKHLSGMVAMKMYNRVFKGLSGLRACFLTSLAFGFWNGSAQAVVPVERISAFSTVMFNPDGQIGEFINVAGDDQEYFVVDPLLVLDPDFGAIKAQAVLTPGVLVRRDDFPFPGSAGEAGPTGHRDVPAIIGGERRPTGFNIGRVFASYNPNAYNGEGAYFLSMDISAPAGLGPDISQPVAFDVDGDGSRMTTDDAGNLVTEVPTNDDDVYRFILDTDRDGVNDVRVTIGERALGRPAGSVFLSMESIPNPPGANVDVVRWVLFEWLAGGAPAVLPEVLARTFLDANNDGVLNSADIGVGDDVEIVIRKVRLLPHHPGADNDPTPTATPECIRITYIADSFDDEPLGGGAEDLVVLEANFPVPDIEVIKQARCVGDPDPSFRDRVSATGGSDVEYRVTIQNWGNRDLNVTLTDLLTSVSPATATIVPGSCVVSLGPGAPFNGAAFCAAFEAALADGSATNVAVGLLEAGDDCEADLGEQVVFTFRVTTGPSTFNTALCDQTVDITNAVSVTGTVPTAIDPILAPQPSAPNDPIASDAEEEDCSDAACCASVPGCAPVEVCQNFLCVSVGCATYTCVPNNGIGDVRDEFTVAVSDDADQIDTRREIEEAADDNVAEVELECRNVTFLKQVRRVGTATFKTGTDALNLPGDSGSYPLDMEFKYTITNAGENPEAYTLTDTSLCTDIAAVAGVDFVAGQCDLCTPPTPGVLSGTVNPGAPFMSSCVVRFNDLASATAFMGADDSRPACRAVAGGQPDPLCYRNCATAETTQGTAQSPICDEGASFDSFATTCVVRECELEVTKKVQCLDSCPNGAKIGVPEDSIMAVPGACAQFSVTVSNTGPIPVPLVCLTDVMTCTWTVSGFRGDIDGDDVTADLVAGGFGPNSGRDCITFPSHPGGLAPGEVLTITFDVQIPVLFPVSGDAVDCRNSIDADGYRNESADTNQPPDSQCTGNEDATIDVKVPRMDCNKTVAVDLDNNGVVDIPATTTANITNVSFPIRLIYTLTTRNTGEVPITGAQICDDDLVANAIAAGATVGPCDLCSGACDGIGDTCADAGDLAVGSPAVVRTCHIVLSDIGEFNAFANSDTHDGRNDCYTNEMRASGEITPPCAPPGFPPTVSSGNCRATVCVTVVPECPVTKAKFDIWNQNERRFSGTERCITSWDQRLLSGYTHNSIANHFGRRSLQTDKGKARIDGVASSVVCGDNSVDVPLIGVAAKVLDFGTQVEMSGISLVGTGVQVGGIKYDLPDGVGGAGPGGGVADPNARSGITTKGSLIVYPKIEIKWGPGPDYPVIQDTFLDISNDYEEAVRVQFYLVNGDLPTAAILNPAGEEIERAHQGCNAVDVEIVLTADQPMHWSALTGDGGTDLFPADFSPFTILDPGFPPGRPDDDPRNAGGRVLRGYALAWAINVDGAEIRWNNLAGDAIIVGYRDSLAWEYNTWNFQAVAGSAKGDVLLAPLGQLSLDGVEYEYAPDRLLMDFYASGARLRPYPNGPSVLIDTDLTLWAVSKDLRRP